jgi:hypothetical protein
MLQWFRWLMPRQEMFWRLPINVRFGSDSEDPSMSAGRPLHLAQRTNAEASLDDGVGPIAYIGSLRELTMLSLAAMRQPVSDGV